MKRFRFRFERLHRVRTLREERAKQSLARQVAILQDLVAKRDALAADLASILDLMRSELASGVFEPARFASLRAQAAGYHARIERAGAEVIRQEGVVARVRAEAAERMRERQVLDRVREHDLAAWRKDYENEQNMLLDEIGSRRARDAEGPAGERPDGGVTRGGR